MINLNKKFLILFCFPFFLSAQTINNIEVNGNTLLSDSEIINLANAFKGNQFYPGLLDSAKSRIAGELSFKGYLNGTFEGSSFTISEDTQKVDLVINIDEGTPTFVNKVFLTSSDSSDLSEIISIFSYLEGEVFNKFEIELNINELLTRLENNGFPFASFTISSVHLYDDTTSDEHLADLYLLLEKGGESSIDRIEIEGNTSTKDYVIIRELRIESGEGYSQQKVDDLPKRLNKLRFFDPVPLPTFYLDSENNGVLLINVKEKNTNNFDGIIGYIPPSTDDENGYVTGLVNVTLRNIFGTGRAAAVRWQKLNRNSQELELKYLEPWLFSYPFNLNGELFQRIQDTTYVQRKIGGSLEYLATEDISAAGFVVSEEVIPTEREEPKFTVYNSSALTTGLSLKIDIRDDPLSPTGGFLFETSYSFSRKKINGPAVFIPPDLETSINLQRLTASLSGFYEIFRRHVIAITVSGRELTGAFFEDSDLWRLGGTRSVRGYREDQFLGSRTAWTNLEYRLLITRRSYAFLFFDSGYYFREAEPERGVASAEDFIFGYGVGLTVETGIGLLGVSFAIAQGETFSEGKFHFGIVNEF